MMEQNRIEAIERIVKHHITEVTNSQTLSSWLIAEALMMPRYLSSINIFTPVYRLLSGFYPSINS